jgi:hypothetical protein
MHRDPLWENAADAAAKILNNHCDPKRSKGVQYFEIIFLIQQAMWLAEEESRHRWCEPSRN